LHRSRSHLRSSTVPILPVVLFYWPCRTFVFHHYTSTPTQHRPATTSPPQHPFPARSVYCNHSTSTARSPVPLHLPHFPTSARQAGQLHALPYLHNEYSTRILVRDQCRRSMCKVQLSSLPSQTHSHQHHPRRGATAGPSRHVIRRKWTGFICEVKSLQWQRLQGLQDATASPPPPRLQWLLLEGAGVMLELPFSTCHVLTASTVTYDAI
jgi:hypothetical protein